MPKLSTVNEVMNVVVICLSCTDSGHICPQCSPPRHLYQLEGRLLHGGRWGSKLNDLSPYEYLSAHRPLPLSGSYGGLGHRIIGKLPKHGDLKH